MCDKKWSLWLQKFLLNLINCLHQIAFKNTPNKERRFFSTVFKNFNLSSLSKINTIENDVQKISLKSLQLSRNVCICYT